MKEKDHSKHGKNPGGNKNNPTLSNLNIPTVYVTSEDEEVESTSSIQNEDFPLNIQLNQLSSFNRDEDAASTAPLLDSGCVTPLEEPSIPLTLGSFLTSNA